MNAFRLILPVVALLTVAAPLSASPVAERIVECAAIRDDQTRLDCFDRVVADQQREFGPRNETGAGSAIKDSDRGAPTGVTAGAAASPGVIIEQQTAEDGARNGQDHVPAAATTQPRPDRTESILSRHWELRPEDKRGTFAFRPHEANYLMVTHTSSPNDAPYQALRPLLPNQVGLSHTELSYQLGFKMKFLEQPFNSPLDIWFAYTQRSFWQAGNRAASSPFRETNYQPEMMIVMPTDVDLLGFKARFVNLGFMHHSNGQGSTLSRSWNRVYLQTGLERGGLTLLARVWQRIGEPASSDDNPDIVRYMGHGDLQVNYHWHGHDFSALLRHNRSSGKGARQIGWAFPIANKLKGYVQYFNGYGQSLIDYNHSLNTIGVGLLVTY